MAAGDFNDENGMLDMDAIKSFGKELGYTEAELDEFANSVAFGAKDLTEFGIAE
jgi:hypothetical protein